MDCARSIACLLLGSAAYAQSVPRVDQLAKGKFLVAKSSLTDPNFAETVVLLATYDKSGAMGLVVNRPTEMPVSRLLTGIPGAGKRVDTALQGGPVQTNAVFALVQAKEPAADDSKQVLPGVYLVTSRETMSKAVANTRPADLRVYFGYAGWGPGQLDMEVTAGAWHVLPADARSVFDPDPESLWDRLVRRTQWRIAYLPAR
jgi:putative transcriptional regulator